MEKVGIGDGVGWMDEVDEDGSSEVSGDGWDVSRRDDMVPVVQVEREGEELA